MGVFNLLSTPLVAWLNKQRPPGNDPLSDYERILHELKPCDVLLVEGRSRVANVIRIVTQSPWTHAALYLGRIHDIEDPDLRTIVSRYYEGEDGERMIIESLLGKGTVISSLAAYQADHLRICRPSRLGHKDAQQVIRYSLSRLGLEYDVRQILDLARFLFPWTILPRRWRSSLFKHNPGRPTRTVCSTMIAEAFAFVQFPILPLVKRYEDDKVQMFRRNPKLCTPSDFDYSPYFEIIKYPFVDFRYEEDYHLLPWRGTGELTAEENQLYMESSTLPTLQDVDDAIEQAIVNATEETEAEAMSPEAEVEPGTTPDPEPGTVPDPETGTAPDPEADTEPDAGPDGEPDPEQRRDIS